MNTQIQDAREVLAKYDELPLEARLQTGAAMLAEVQARALVSIAESLEQLARGES